MTASAFLDAVVPSSLRHNKAKDQSPGKNPADADTASNQDGDEQSYEHVNHRDSQGYDHGQRHSSGQMYMDNYAQSHKPYTPDEVHNDPQKKQLGGAAPDMKFEDFELLKTLGTGTFARVWLTRYKKASGSGQKQNQVFALKVLRKADVIRLKQVEHIKNERTTLASVAGHPFITTLVLTFKDRESIYMLLDYCPGGELFTYLRRQKRFEEPEAKFYAAEITLVFEYLHDKEGIVYRDLKPENILLDERGHVKLVDFGFAKALKKQEQHTFTLCGTPEYLAPEVIKNTGKSSHLQVPDYTHSS